MKQSSTHPAGAGATRRRPLEAARFLVLAGAIAVLGAACGGKGNGAGAAAGGAFQRPPTPVEAASVSNEAVIDRFQSVGTIEAAEEITVVSEIPGTVVSLPFREGDHVSKGELLAQIDDRELRAALDRAQAILAQKEAAFKRVELVVQQGAGAPQDLDDASAARKIAQADVDLAAARLAKSHIAAPFAGRVGPREVSPGAFLQPGTPITELARIDQIKVIFTAPERYVPKLARGAKVSVSTTAFPGVTLDGLIDVVDPVLDPDTRSAEVIVRADNPGERFRPGMSADITAVLSRRDKALTIPAEAVFAEGKQSLVYLIQADSSVAKTPVVLGSRLPGAVEVISGLEAGQRVVRAGHQKLYPGAKVLPIESRAPGVQGAPSDAGAAGAPGDASGDKAPGAAGDSGDKEAQTGGSGA